MGKASADAPRKKALRASSLIVSFLDHKPDGSESTLGQAIDLDVEVIMDMFDLKKADPRVKAVKAIHAIFKQADLLEELKATMDENNVRHPVISLVEPETEPEWPLAAPVNHKKGSASSKGRATAKPLVQSGPAAADAQISKLQSTSWASIRSSFLLWCWSQAPLLMVIYSSLFKVAKWFPSLGLNFVLACGLIFIVVGLCNAENFGEALGEYLSEVPSFMATWLHGFWRGLRRSKTVCPPCPMTGHLAVDEDNHTVFVAHATGGLEPPATPPFGQYSTPLLSALLGALGVRLWGAQAAAPGQ